MNFPASVPEEEGLCTSDLWAMLDDIETQCLEVTTMMLLVNGKVVIQFCKKPYEPECPQLWFSTTKMITGIGVGIAYDKSFIDIDDYVISFFPDKLPAVISENLKNLRIRHLLSMSSGIHENTYAALYPQDDWVKAFLAQDFPHKPGTYYRYSTHASHLLSAIIERATGISFYDFIKVNLLNPLGIKEMTWETCTQGVTAGGMGLGLAPEAMARFGYTLLNKGIYDNKIIISEDYLSLATTKQSDTRIQDKGPHINGYGFHMCIDHDGSYYHAGSFGQLCYISPKKNAVLVVNSRKRNWDEIIDLFQSLFGLHNKPREHITFSQLKHRLDSMTYPAPDYSPTPLGTIPRIRASYAMQANDIGLSHAVFDGDDINLEVQLLFSTRPPSCLNFNFKTPVKSKDFYVKDIQYHLQRYISYANWSDSKSLDLTVIYIETPYVVSYKVCFDMDTVVLDYKVNVGFGPLSAHIIGQLKRNEG